MPSHKRRENVAFDWGQKSLVGIIPVNPLVDPSQFPANSQLYPKDTDWGYTWAQACFFRISPRRQTPSVALDVQSTVVLIVEVLIYKDM